MFAVPALTPDTIPLADTVAIALPPSVQVPPVVLDDKVVAEPSHTLRVPEIVPGSGLTVMVPVTRQPVASV